MSTQSSDTTNQKSVAARQRSAGYGVGRIEIPLHSQAPYDRDHPILLHELSHAYYDAKIWLVKEFGRR